MTRWDSVISLVSDVSTQRADGSFARATDSVDVYANRRKVSSSTWLAAKSAGLHADAQYQIHSCDYDGQTIAVVDEVEYEVEATSNTGDFMILTLKRRAVNG